MSVSQCDRVLDVLADGKVHTVPEIHERAGTMRLNSRVAELRKRGHTIICQRQPGARGAEAYAYQLVEAPSQPGPASNLPLPAGPGLPPRQAGALVDPDVVCATCGHAAYSHVNGASVAGDCLHQVGGRFVCGCEGFVDAEEQAA